MELGIQLKECKITGILKNGENIIKSTYHQLINEKYFSKKHTMENILLTIDGLNNSLVNGIGVSLPCVTHPQKGIVYDLDKIPHWKSFGLKKILEKKFHLPVFINTDISCFALGEYTCGYGKNLDNLICVNYENSLTACFVANGKLSTENPLPPTQPGCMSKIHQNCIKTYRNSYLRAIEELDYYAKVVRKESKAITTDVWCNVGAITARIISILHSNFNPQIVVLGGRLAQDLIYFEKEMNDCIRKYIKSEKGVPLTVIAEKNEVITATGAACLVERNYCKK